MDAELRLEREPWRARAACLGHPHPEWWFPVRGSGPRARDDERSPAYAVCATCPVGADCEDFRRSEDLGYGIWNGVEWKKGKPVDRG